MPLQELNTDEFITYNQTLRVAKDQYTARKVQKDRVKHVNWFNTVLSQKDMVLTFLDVDGNSQQCIASKNAIGAVPLPEIPVTIENVLDEDVEQVQHVAFYKKPSGDVELVHIDNIVSWTITNTLINQIDKIYKKSTHV